MKNPDRRYDMASAGRVVVFLVTLLLGAFAAPSCKRAGDDAAKKPAAAPAVLKPTERAATGGKRRLRDGGKGGGAHAVAVARAAPATPLPDTARFVSVAELKKHPLFAPFSEFVETEDDNEESTSSESGSSDDDDDDTNTSPDRPPSDLTITRIGLAGEVYVLAYEENCGEDLEDKRNLSQVLLERRAGTLQEHFRKGLCGEAQRGMSVDLVKLTATGPELVVRSWLIDRDGASEHSLRAFRMGNEGLVEIGLIREAIDGASRFDVSFPEKGPHAEVELGVHEKDEDGLAKRRVLRYNLAPGGFSRVNEGVSAATRNPAAATPAR